MSFKNNSYQVVNNAISKEYAKHCAIEFQLQYEFIYYVSNGFTDKSFDFGDPQVANSFTAYAPLFGETLLLVLKPKIEKVTNRKLLPAYSYARIYFPGANMLMHTDRKSCEISATLTLDVDGEVWPISFLDNQNNRKDLILNPGSMVVYEGPKLEHWRSSMDGEKTKTQTQVFLHYVDANGPFTEFKYDTRPYIGFPKEFKK